MAGGSISPPGGFSKNAASKETMKPCFFASFNIIIHIFPECFIEIHHAGGSYVIKNLFVNIGYFHCFLSIFLIFFNLFVTKKLMTSAYNK